MSALSCLGYPEIKQDEFASLAIQMWDEMGDSGYRASAWLLRDGWSYLLGEQPTGDEPLNKPSESLRVDSLLHSLAMAHSLPE